VVAHRCTGFVVLGIVTTIAIAAIVIAFRRFASNERIAYAVAFGAARRRGETNQ
jgi:hypothetical protein